MILIFIKKIGLGGIPDKSNKRNTINFWFIIVLFKNPTTMLENKSFDKTIITDIEPIEYTKKYINHMLALTFILK